MFQQGKKIPMLDTVQKVYDKQLIHLVLDYLVDPYSDGYVNGTMYYKYI